MLRSKNRSEFLRMRNGIFDLTIQNVSPVNLKMTVQNSFLVNAKINFG